MNSNKNLANNYYSHTTIILGIVLSFFLSTCLAADTTLTDGMTGKNVVSFLALGHKKSLLSSARVQFNRTKLKTTVTGDFVLEETCTRVHLFLRPVRQVSLVDVVKTFVRCLPGGGMCGENRAELHIAGRPPVPAAYCLCRDQVRSQRRHGPRRHVACEHLSRFYVQIDERIPKGRGASLLTAPG